LDFLLVEKGRLGAEHKKPTKNPFGLAPFGNSMPLDEKPEHKKGASGFAEFPNQNQDIDI